MTALLLYSLLSAAMFYLGSRAMITQSVWTHYPPAFARFMDCAACTGFWWGVIGAFTIGRANRLDFFGLDPWAYWTPALVGLCTLVTTPLFAHAMQDALEGLGTIVTTDEDTSE